MTRDVKRSQRGFTIVELLVAMMLVTVLVGVAFQIGIVVVTGYRQHRQAVAVQRAARGSIDLIADAVRNASAGVPSGALTDAAGCTTMSAIAVTNSTTQPDELAVITAAGGLVTSLREAIDASTTSFDVVDATGLAANDLLLVTDFETGHVLRVTSVTDNGASWTIGVEASGCAGVVFNYPIGALVLRAKISRFYVEDVDGVPTMFLDPDADGEDVAEPLAEGVEDFQVAIGVDVDGDGAVSDTGGSDDEWFHNDAGDGAPPDLMVTPWRALRLTVVARTTLEDTGGQWSARPTVEDHDGAAVDGHRRRVVSTIVEIRNLEGSP